MPDHDARARTEAIELVIVGLLAASLGRRRLRRHLKRGEIDRLAREIGLPLPANHDEGADTTLRHYHRLLRLALATAEQTRRPR